MKFRGRPVFYGWYIAWTGAVMQLMLAALVQQSYGAYVKVLRDQFGWSKTLFSAAYSLSRVETGALGPVEGWLIDRFGPRALMQAGLVMVSAGFVLFSQIRSPWMFMVAFMLLAVGGSFASFLPLSVAVVNWFERHRARALTITSLGFATGGLLVPVVVLALEQFGWRQTAFASAVIVLAVGLPLSTLVRHRPEPYGYRRDGLPPAVTSDGAPVEEDDWQANDFTIRQALATKSFWFVSLGHASALLIVSAVQVHLVLHITDNLGYSLARAGAVVALMTVMQMLGQGIAGLVGDRWSKRWIAVVCMAAHALGLVTLAYAAAFWMVIAFAVMHGVAWGTRGPLMAAIRADYFGGRNFGTIMGTSSLIAMLGNTSGPLLAGVLADRTGNYELGFTILALLSALGSVFFMVARPPGRPNGGVRARIAEPSASTTAPAAAPS